MVSLRHLTRTASACIVPDAVLCIWDIAIRESARDFLVMVTNDYATMTLWLFSSLPIREV